MFTDSHCHLADAAFADRLPQTLHQARQAGVHRFIVPAAEAADWPAVYALSESSPDILGALGIHPWFAEHAESDCIEKLARQLQRQPEMWVGEIGLDYHRSRSEKGRRKQRDLLSQQLAIARQLNRPVILHNLRSSNDLLALLKQHGIRRGIVHAFSGSLEEAEAFIKQGLLIGIGSLLLNPAAKKARRAAAELPLSSLVLETDSPFMLANGTNTPANLREIATVAAQLRGTGLSELAQQTEKNIDSLCKQMKRTDLDCRPGARGC